ncbi:MAG: type II secretion system F family protein [Candidatus Thorarchaeota archaeon]|jgi:tight adherence protein B
MLLYIALMVFAAVFLSTLSISLILRERFARTRRLVKRRMEDLATEGKTENDIYESIMKDDSLSTIPVIDRILSKFMFSKNLQRLIDQSGVAANAGTMIMACVSLAGLLLLIVYHLTGNLAYGFLAGVPAGLLPILYIFRKRKKRVEQFESLMPEAMDMITSALRSGFSFELALKMVAHEIPDPLGIEFAITFEQQNLGANLDVALHNLLSRVPSEDLALFVTAMMIHKNTGGNLAEILEKTSSTIRDRFRFKKEVRTKTVHGRFSGFVLIALPLAVIAIMLVIHPDYFMTLIRDKVGNYMLGAAAIMQLLGLWLIARIVNIKI